MFMPVKLTLYFLPRHLRYRYWFYILEGQAEVVSR